MVTRPKSKGGLGVIKLNVQNDALLMKNLDKFFNKRDLPWVQLIWPNYYRNGKVPGEIRKCSFWWRSMLGLLNTYILRPMQELEIQSCYGVTYGMEEFFRMIIKNCFLLQKKIALS
jgi:hypothetical protein